MNGNGLDSLESLRALIRVEDKVKKEMFKYDPAEEIRRILRFRKQVLEVFEELVAKQEKVLEGLALKQEKKALRRSRFLTKRTVPTDANLTSSIYSRKAQKQHGIQGIKN